MRGLAAPLRLVVARARRRPGRWLPPALGIALVTAFAVVVAAAGVVAGDESARGVLSGVAPLDRSVRLSWQGALEPGVGERARALFAGLRLGAPTEVALLGPVRLSGVVVRPAAVEPLERWLPGAGSASLGPCRAARCAMVLAGGGKGRGTVGAIGVRIRVVGQHALTASTPLGFAPAGDAPEPVLLTGDVPGLTLLAGLSGVYRIHSWVAALAAAGLPAWTLASTEAKLARAQAGIEAADPRFMLSAPFAGLDAARAQAAAAPRRLLLAGGGAIAALMLFVALVAGGLRRDQLEELGRLRGSGATTSQCAVFATAESAWLSAVSLITGAGVGLGAAAVLAGASGEPVGGVLWHSALTPEGVVALAAAWLLATALLTVPVLARSGRLVDGVAVAAAGALVAALVINPGGGDAFSLLLAPLSCLAAGVLIYRAAAMLLRACERISRRGPLPLRLALVGLARAPAVPALVVAFIAVSVGLGGFALAYRATLLRGAADQAADSVPLDALISPSQDFTTPLELAPATRWSALAHGAVLPVRRTEASYTAGAGTVTVPALGVPAGGLPLIHGWRESDGSAPLATLAGRLRPAGPARTPGPMLPSAARWLSLAATSPALDIAVTADLRDAAGAVRRVPLGTAGTGATPLRARVPPGQWELEGLEVAEPTGLEVTNGHQNGENPGAATQFQTQVSLGPVLAELAPGRPLLTVPLDRWRALGAASHSGRGSGAASHSERGSGAASHSEPARDSHEIVVAFAATGVPGLLRPVQPSDRRPVPVLVDPGTAAATAAGGRLLLTVDGFPVRARVVGTLRRFPTLAPDAAGFVVADEATLSGALEAQMPGQGRPDELWISSSRATDLRAALRTGPLAKLAASFRLDRETSLWDGPVARGVLGTLNASAAVSAGLAVLGLLTALLGGARDRWIERDLEAQGAGPRMLAAEAGARLLVASGLGVLAGLVLAVLLTDLAVVSVSAALATDTPRPPLIAVVPWGWLAAWGAGALAVLAAATRISAGRVIGRRRARVPARSPAAARTAPLEGARAGAEAEAPR